MDLSKNNIFLKNIIFFKYRKLLIDEYNIKSGEYNTNTLIFAKPIIEKSKIYLQYIKKKQLHEICPGQFNIFRYNRFLYYFLLRFLMFFIGLPFLLIITTCYYLSELFNQYKYMKKKINSLDYHAAYRSIHITPCRFIFQSIMAPLAYYFNFIFGFAFERWAVSFIPFLLLYFAHPFVIFLNISLFAFLAAISPILLVYHFFLLIKKNDQSQNQNTFYTFIAKLFKKQMDIK